MKRKLLGIVVCFMLLISLLPVVPAAAAESIPTDGLDIWLEADSGVTTDGEGNVTAWQSKVNGAGAESPYVLNQLSNAGDAGYVAPVVHDIAYGKKAVYFKGKSLATEQFTSYKGEITEILLTKNIGRESGFTTGYLTDTDMDSGSYKSRGLKINRKNTTYEINSNGGGVGGGSVLEGYTVLTEVSANRDISSGSNMDTDGTPLKAITTYQDNVRKNGPFNSNSNDRIGYDTISRYQIGHRCDDEVAAYIVYRKALSEEERTQVYNYLVDKYLTAPSNPTAQSAAISADGISVTITADMALAGTANAADFTVTAGGTAASVTGASINAAGAVVLTLQTPVEYGQAVTVSYTGTAVTNQKGESLSAFSNLTVDVSAIPAPAGINPTIQKAMASAKGDKIQLTADIALAGTPSAADFSVAGQTSGALTVASTALSGKDIVLTLSAPFAYKDTVTVSYTGTSVESKADGAKLEPFSNQAVEQYTLERIPTDGLDIWLEADAGITTDANGNITAWQSKVNGVDKTQPHVLDQLSTLADAGYVAPTVKTLDNGQKTVYFKGKSLATATLDSVYRGPVSVVMLTKNIAAPGDGYLLESSTNINGQNRGVKFLRLPESKGANYTIASQSGGLGVGNKTDGYSVLTMVSEDIEGQLDTDGTTPLHNINTWQNDKKYVTNFETNTTNRVGFDTVSWYRLGHRCDDEIAAFLVYKRAISDVERESVYQYLYEKYMMDSKFTLQNLSASFKTADGTASDVPVGGGKAELSGAFVNGSVEAVPSAKVIAASFNGDVLADALVFSLTDCTAGKENAFLLDLALPEDVSKLSVKLFLWDDLLNVRPLMKYTQVLPVQPAE